jgi:hypothetical protein
LKGLVLLRSSRPREARAEFEEVLRIEPQGPMAGPAAEYLKDLLTSEILTNMEAGLGRAGFSNL